MDLLDPAYLRSDACRDDFARLRAETPIFWHAPKDQPGFWAVLKHADIIAISSDPERFASKHGVFIYDQPTGAEGALLFTDPPEHRRLRRFVTGYFMGKGVSRLAPWIRAECADLVNRAVIQGNVDFIADLAVNLPLNTIAQIMQLQPVQRDRLLAISDEMASAGAGGGDRAARAMLAMSDLGIELARERRAQPGDDLVSTMLDVTDSGGAPLSDKEFGMMFMQIAGAATDTTRGVLGDIIIKLAQHPELMEELRAGPALVRGMVEEVLRMSPPVYYMRRTATRDTTLGNVEIKRGQKLVMYYLSANHDEDVFSHPERFDITRHPNPHLSFGIGEHVCLGLNVARLEIRLFVEELLRAVKEITLRGIPEQELNTESTRYVSMSISVTA